MPTRSLRGKEIKLYCTLKSKQGALLGNYGALLTVGRHVSIKLAKQLLSVQSAILVGEPPAPLLPDPRVWPDPVRWGHFQPHGNVGKTVSVHIPIYLDGAGSNPFWIKLSALGSTFRKLFDHYRERSVKQRSFGMLMIMAVRAGMGIRPASKNTQWPAGMDVQNFVVGRIVSGRSVPVRIHIKHNGHEHVIKLAAEKDVFRRLAGYHKNDEISDARFGHLLYLAMMDGRNHVVLNNLRKKQKRGKQVQIICWKTAAWLGPALLDKMKSAFENHSVIIQNVEARMFKECPQLPVNPRNMVAFLVHKNWQNWAARRPDLKQIQKWPTSVSPIMRPRKKNVWGSGDFWDEIFNRQLKLKRFPWARLRNSNPERIKELVEPAIDRHKALHVQNNPGFDWKTCKEEHPDQFDAFIAKFVEDHMSFYQFRLTTRVSRNVARRMKCSEAQIRGIVKDPESGDMLLAVPTDGPTFILPKSLEETVEDILLNRNVFILLPQF